jgi:hypothetical protein
VSSAAAAGIDRSLLNRRPIATLAAGNRATRRREVLVRLDDVVSSGPVVLVDAGVVRDMAATLTGLWDPGRETDPARAAEMVAAARTRLYGDRDRSGWTLLTTRSAADSALKRGDADWSVGMIAVIDEFEDAPPEADVSSLASLYRREEGIDAEAAETLATAVLWEPVSIVISRLPRGFRHGREGDLPARLELLDARQAEERLEIGVGEPPQVSLPIGSMLAESTPWWVPA